VLRYERLDRRRPSLSCALLFAAEQSTPVRSGVARWQSRVTVIKRGLARLVGGSHVWVGRARGTWEKEEPLSLRLFVRSLRGERDDYLQTAV